MCECDNNISSGRLNCKGVSDKQKFGEYLDRVAAAAPTAPPATVVANAVEQDNAKSPAVVQPLVSAEVGTSPASFENTAPAALSATDAMQLVGAQLMSTEMGLLLIASAACTILAFSFCWRSVKQRQALWSYIVLSNPAVPNVKGPAKPAEIDSV